MKEKYPVIEDIEDYPGSVIVMVLLRNGMITQGYWNYGSSVWMIDLDGSPEYTQIQEDELSEWHYITTD